LVFAVDELFDGVALFRIDVAQLIHHPDSGSLTFLKQGASVHPMETGQQVESNSLVILHRFKLSAIVLLTILHKLLTN
jgi:hypothetical protein